jgi:hypothetical protein
VSNVVGTLPGWLTLITLAGVGYVLLRGGSPQAIAGLRDINSELERQIKEKEGTIKTLERVNAELRAEKDVAVALIPVIEALRGHEARAQERHVGTLKVLDLIAHHLGPDNGREDG